MILSSDSKITNTFDTLNKLFSNNVTNSFTERTHVLKQLHATHTSSDGNEPGLDQATPCMYKPNKLRWALGPTLSYKSF